MRSLLRIRNVRIYLLGDVISTLGDNALWLAMAIWMKELTGSSAWAGLVIFCYALGNLFSPLGGVLADRFPRRPLLIGANLLAALVVLPAAVAAVAVLAACYLLSVPETRRGPRRPRTRPWHRKRLIRPLVRPASCRVHIGMDVAATCL